MIDDFERASAQMGRRLVAPRPNLHASLPAHDTPHALSHVALPGRATAVPASRPPRPQGRCVQKRWPWRKHLRNGTDWLEAEPTASWLRSHATPPPSRSSALPPAAATSAAERMTRAQWTARVSAWYVERARAIDVLSGQLHHATDLLKLGIEPRKVRATLGAHLPGLKGLTIPTSVPGLGPPLPDRRRSR